MTIRDLCTWSKVPDDLILDNMWYMTVTDGVNNTSSNRIGDSESKILDTYIKSISIPFDTVDFEKTNFGMLNIKERNFPSSISISMFDSNKTPYIGKFRNWLECIYDFEKNCVKNEWRKEHKNITVTQIKLEKVFNKYKYLTESAIRSTVPGLISIPSAFGYVDLSDVSAKKIIEYELKNCYISKIDDLSLDTDGGQPQEFSIELECEKSTMITFNDINAKID